MTTTPTTLCRRRSIQPTVESLGERCLPACNIFPQAGGLLIVGSALRDRVIIGDNGQGRVAVICDNNRAAQVFNGVNQITVRMLGGTDTVRYNLLGMPTGRHTVTVSLGPGPRDRCDVFLNNFDFGAGSSLAFTLNGAAGRDVFNFTTTADPDTTTLNTLTLAVGVLPPGFNPVTGQANPTPGSDIATGASLSCRIRGGTSNDGVLIDYTGIVQGSLSFDIACGGGNDAVALAYRGTIDGLFTVLVDGGAAADTLIVNVFANNDSNGRVTGNVLGGAGDDVLTLNVRRPDSVLAPLGLTVDATVDGGTGTDRCTVTGNVRRLRCER